MTDQHSSPNHVVAPSAVALLPCPLCRSEGHTLLRGICFPDESVDKEAAVMCPTCGCRATLKAWNTRAPATPAPDVAKLAERLKAAAVSFEGQRAWHANAVDGDCEPHDSWQVEMDDASKAAIEAAELLPRLSAENAELKATTDKLRRFLKCARDEGGEALERAAVAEARLAELSAATDDDPPVGAQCPANFRKAALVAENDRLEARLAEACADRDALAEAYASASRAIGRRGTEEESLSDQIALLVCRASAREVK